LGTAYTAGEVLYHEKRFDDAAHNFETVINKAKKFPFLTNAARLRLAQTYLMNDQPATALISARDVAGTNNKFSGRRSVVHAVPRVPGDRQSRPRPKTPTRTS